MTQISWDHLQLEGEIGYGSFGTVYQAKLDGNAYALKEISIPADPALPPAQGRAACREIAQNLLEEIRIEPNHACA